MRQKFKTPIFRLKRSALMISAALLAMSCGGDKSGDSSSSVPNNLPFAHQDNVFAAVDRWYVNRWWSENAKHDGGDAIAQHNTGLWMGRIGDIETVAAGEIPDIWRVVDGTGPDNGYGLKDHFLEAENQGNALVQLVVYNAPGRDCADIVSFGELPASEYGMEVYRTHYIDRIAAVLEQFPHIPVAAIIEPESLYRLVLNRLDDPCLQVSNAKAWGYTNAVRYAVNSLSQFDNVHIYLDAGASNHVGWDDDLAMVSLFMHGVIAGFDGLYDKAKTMAWDIEASEGALGRYEGAEEIYIEPPPFAENDPEPPGYGKIDGFITNLRDYVPLDEPHMGDPREPMGPNPLRSAWFYEWNPRIDEWTYSEDWLAALEEHGATIDGLGMLIDTSRNGWGQRMAALESVDPIQDPELVNDYRIDGREHRMNYCNQQGAGLGARPQANPDGKDWIDAYVWGKPPGESDGISIGPDDPRWPVEPHEFLSWRHHDPMCDPENLSTPGQKSPATRELILGTGAMEDAPHVDRWFEAGIHSLMTNAWPVICEGKGDVCDD